MPEEGDCRSKGVGSVRDTTVLLNDGATRMPLFGMGSDGLTPDVARRAVLQALQFGYRRIDSAMVFPETERDVGIALHAAFDLGLQREQLFLSSKLWCSDMHPEDAAQATLRCCQRLGVQYLDLLLMHWPVAWAKQQSEPILVVTTGLPAIVDLTLPTTTPVANTVPAFTATATSAFDAAAATAAAATAAGLLPSVLDPAAAAAAPPAPALVDLTAQGLAATAGAPPQVLAAAAAAPAPAAVPAAAAEGSIADATVNFVRTWAAMEELVLAGLVRAIGVCNASANELDVLLRNCRIRPAVNQVECHPYLNQKELRSAIADAGIRLSAYSLLGIPSRPLGRPTAGDAGDSCSSPLEEPDVLRIAAQHRRSPGQVLLRWHLQKGDAVVVTSSEAHIVENSCVFSFELTEEEVERLDDIGKRTTVRLHNPPYRQRGVVMFPGYPLAAC